MSTPPDAIRLTGTVFKWDPLKGCGFIVCEQRTFFAHAKEFRGDCACGQRHKCEIKPGMRVQFMVTELDPPHLHGKLPAAMEIRTVVEP